MLLNCSNHVFENWSEEQLKVASQWGEIIDYPFPQVPAIADEVYISKQADDIVKDIRSMQPSVVMCQGEFTLSYMIITKLLESGIKVIAACSERKTDEVIFADGHVEKRVVFQFIRFREYCLNNLR